MGGGSGPAGAGLGSSEALLLNIARLRQTFPVTADGYFGRRSPKRGADRRQIESDDPVGTARRFFAIASTDALLDSRRGGGVVIAFFRGGSHVVFREVSISDGSPAVEVAIKSRQFGLAARQKIHFIRRSK